MTVERDQEEQLIKTIRANSAQSLVFQAHPNGNVALDQDMVLNQIGILPNGTAELKPTE